MVPESPFLIDYLKDLLKMSIIFLSKHTSKMLTRIKSDLDLLTGALTSTSIIFRDCNGNWYQLFDFFLVKVF